MTEATRKENSKVATKLTQMRNLGLVSGHVLVTALLLGMDDLPPPDNGDNNGGFESTNQVAQFISLNYSLATNKAVVTDGFILQSAEEDEHVAGL